MFQDNPYQRQTQDIKNKEALVDLNNVRRIMLLSRQKKFSQIILMIQETIQSVKNNGKQFYPQNLQSELNLLKLFYQTINQGKPVDFGSLQQLENEQRIKMMILDLNTKLKKNIKVDDKQIEQVIKFAYDNPALKQEFMFKIVGCKSIKRMLQISKQQIDDLTPDVQKKAIKFQIAADWKYILENQDEAIDLKQQSIQAWAKTKKNQRMNLAIKQFNHLITLCKGQIIDNIYVNKLKTMRKIVKLLEKVPEINNFQAIMKSKKKTLLSIMIPNLLKQMHIQTQQKEQKNMGNSILKKKGQIESRRQIGKKFIEEITKNNYCYCQFVPDNRLEVEKIKQLQKTMGVLKRIYMKIARLSWINIIEFIEKKAMVQKQKQKKLVNQKEGSKNED